MHERQFVGVVLTLHGVQDFAVVAHHASTPEAAVSVRIGRMLMYIHDRPTAARFAATWRRFSHDALRLPRESGRPRVPPAAQDDRGSAEAAVLIDARGAPPASGQMLRPTGRASTLRIQLERVVFDVRDLGAFASTKRAFADAEALAASALPDPDPDAARRSVFERAAQALPADRRPRRVASPPRSDPTRAPVRAPRLGRAWMS
ncbi:hypothetical protein [Pseudonocardia sp. DLS-67]